MRKDIEEGDMCPKRGPECMGWLKLTQHPCYCNAGNAPCSNCTNAYLECDCCGWTDDDANTNNALEHMWEDVPLRMRTCPPGATFANVVIENNIPSMEGKSMQLTVEELEARRKMIQEVKRNLSLTKKIRSNKCQR